MSGVRLRGPLFSKDPQAVVKRALHEETVKKVGERWMRKGRRAGRRNNTLTAHFSSDGLSLKVTSTLNNPRQVGAIWQRNNIAAARAMAPRVLNKAAKRIAADLGGG